MAGFECYYDAGGNLNTRKLLSKVGVGVLLVSTAAWFLSPPNGLVAAEWRFQWEPLLAFLVACGSFLYSALDDTDENRPERENIGTSRSKEIPAHTQGTNQEFSVRTFPPADSYPKWDRSDLKIAKQFLNLYDSNSVETFGSGVPDAFVNPKLQDMMAMEEAAKNSSFCFSDRRIDDPFQKFLNGLKSLMATSIYAFDAPDDRYMLIRPELYYIDEFVVKGYMEGPSPSKKSRESALLRKMAADIMLMMEGGNELVAVLRKYASSTFSKYERLHNLY